MIVEEFYAVVFKDAYDPGSSSGVGVCHTAEDAELVRKATICPACCYIEKVYGVRIEDAKVLVLGRTSDVFSVVEP